MKKNAWKVALALADTPKNKNCTRNYSVSGTNKIVKKRMISADFSQLSKLPASFF
jgi:hypothetical protein